MLETIEVVLPSHIAAEGSCTLPKHAHVEFNPDTAKDTRPAELVCRRCSVAGACLAWAVSNPGVRGVYSGVLFFGQGAPARILRDSRG